MAETVGQRRKEVGLPLPVQPSWCTALLRSPSHVPLLSIQLTGELSASPGGSPTKMRLIRNYPLIALPVFAVICFNVCNPLKPGIIHSSDIYWVLSTRHGGYSSEEAVEVLNSIRERQNRLFKVNNKHDQFKK